MKNTVVLILVVIQCLQISFAQQGKQGERIIYTNNVCVNEYTSLTADAIAGNTSITVSDNSLNTNNRFTYPLSKGDLIMIIQMQGATISSAPLDSTWGAITNYNNCGVYEFVQVSGVTGTTTIDVCPLKNNYNAAAKAQVVRVPRLLTLTIDANDTVIGDSWNGTQGGVIAIEVSSSTIINGAINANAIGFRGGQVVNLPNGPDSSTIYTSNNANGTFAYGAEKGESIAGYQTDYNVYGGMYGRAAPANGGGGGDVWDAAGGGGANGGNVNLWNGNGNPDPAYATEWNLEYVGFANSTSPGGGRGGYATASNDLGPTGPTTYGPNNSVWSFGYYRENVGGKGGRPLNYSARRLFVGGGGGAGHEDNSNESTIGGNGGGLVYLLSYGTVSGSGSILSNGQEGANDNSMAAGAPQNDGDGTGGGGAGGTIVINSVGNISSISLYANGGEGGNQYIENTVESEGAGGGGGGGYIATTNAGLFYQVNGGVNGTTNSASMSSFPPDGATIGGGGVDTLITNNLCGIQQLSAITGPPIVCPNKSYTYSVTSNCGYATYTWTLPTGWTGTSTTNTITVTTPQNLVTPDTILVTNCPLDTFLAINANQAPPNPDFPADTTICGPIKLTLNAGSTTFNYLWSTGATTPAITVTDTGKYKLMVYSDCDTVSDSTIIFRSQFPKIYLGNDTAVCSFTNYMLKPKADSFVTAYLWSTGAITDSILVPGIGTYWVTATNNCGMASDTIIISSCEGAYILANAFTPGDGTNNLLGLIKTGNGTVKLVTFNIYNRWGQLVFTTTDDQNKWDGRFNGQPEQIGVYVYFVKYMDTFGVTKLLKGNITLLK